MQAEFFLTEIIPGNSFELKAFESNLWKWLVRIAFALMPIGWILMGFFVSKILLSA